MPGTRRPARLMLVALVTLLVCAAVLALAVRWLEPRFAFFPDAGESETPRSYGVTYAPLTVATADGEQLRAWLMRAREPRATVVYFHGNGGNLSLWASILAGVARHGYSVLAFDYRGYGVSTGRPTERGLYRDVDAVLGRVVETREPGVPLIYWGRSLGCSMAAYAASVHAPDGIVLESGFPDARAVVRSSPPLAFLALFSTYRFPAAALMERVRAPALVLHGDRDSVIPFALGRALYEGIPGPKQFVSIRGGDHNDAVPADQNEYWGAVERFVSGLPRPSRP